MKNLFVSSDFEDILERVEAIAEDQPRKWGKMSVDQMICHNSDPFRDLLGLRSTSPVTPPEMWPKILEMVLVEDDWAQDLPTFPPYLQGGQGGGTPPTNFQEDKKTLIRLLTTFYTTPADFEFFPHAGLGYLTRDLAGQFMWKHMDHHLRQFGA